MNFEDVQKANALAGEKTTIQRAIESLKGSGRIVAMTVAGEGAPPVMVGTGYITYPPQMVAGIEAAFETRLKEIADELEKLGVTLPAQAEAAKASKK